MLLDEKQESRGSVPLQIPGRLRWNYEAPQPSVMLVKDGRFARYIPRASRSSAGQAKGEADLLVGFGPGAAGLGKKYQVTLVGEEAVGERADPRSRPEAEGRPGRPLLRASVSGWTRSGGSRCRRRLTEPTGDHTTIRFDDGADQRAAAREGASTWTLPGDVVEVK